MFIKDLAKCEEFFAGDNSILRELLNPDKDYVSLRYSLAFARVKPGDITFKHKMKSSEVYYILNGEGEIHIDDDVKEVFPHQAIYIPPNSIQWIKSTGDEDLTFLCIVDPAWTLKDEKILG